MAIDLTDTMNHIVALEKEGMAALSPSVIADAVPRYIHVQEGFPYWTNRTALMTPSDDSQDFRVYEYDITARLVIGHITQGYVGEPEENLQVWLPHMVEWFDQRELLQSDTFPEPPGDLVSALVANVRESASNMLNVTQYGVEITIRCKFEESIIQQEF